MQWGKAQTHCVTVTLRVTLFPVSYAALPWCANSGSEKIETPMPRATHIKNLPFKAHLLRWGKWGKWGKGLRLYVEPTTLFDGTMQTASATVKLVSNDEIDS